MTATHIIFYSDGAKWQHRVCLNSKSKHICAVEIEVFLTQEKLQN